MTNQLLTKCPHCETTFRLSPAQLETAQGAVRCGACLQVFHASDYLIDQDNQDDLNIQSEPSQEKTYEKPGISSGSFSPSNSTKAQPFSFDSSNQENNADIYGYYEPKLGGKSQEEDDEAWAEALLRELNEEESAASFGESIDTPSGAADDNLSNQNCEVEPASSFDFSEALPDAFQQLDEQPVNSEPLKAERDDPSAQFAEQPKGAALIDESELSDTFKQLESFEEEPLHESPFSDSIMASPETSSDIDGADESWANSMLSDLENEANSVDHQNLELEQQKENDAGLFGLGYTPQEVSDSVKKEAKTGVRSKLDQDIDAFFSENANDEATLELISEGSKDDELLFSDGDLTPQIIAIGNDDSTDLLDGFTDEEIPNLLTDHDKSESAQDYLSKIQTDSFDITLPESGSNRTIASLIASFSLILIALLVLLGQYTVYNYDSLARQENLRPYFLRICDRVACKVPSINDASRIRGANLVIRSHPVEANALVVDAIIYNRAKFKQPFPILQLSFSGLNGSLIAHRDFEPREYRRGELLHIHSMPPNTPIHLSLEIVDPGPKAVNYHLQFRYPESKKQS